jgi:hypothetical protein
MITVLKDVDGGPLGREVIVTHTEERRTLATSGRIVAMQAGLCSESRRDGAASATIRPGLLLDTGNELVFIQNWDKCEFRYKAGVP